MSVINADIIPSLSDEDIELELMLLAEKPVLEPWEKTQAARLRVALKERAAPPVVKRVASVMKSNAVELKRLTRELLDKVPDPEFEALMRKAGLLD